MMTPACRCGEVQALHDPCSICHCPKFEQSPPAKPKKFRLRQGAPATSREPGR
jgi:hypothetical protein